MCDSEIYTDLYYHEEKPIIFRNNIMHVETEERELKFKVKLADMKVEIEEPDAETTFSTPQVKPVTLYEYKELEEMKIKVEEHTFLFSDCFSEEKSGTFYESKKR